MGGGWRRRQKGEGRRLGIAVMGGRTPVWAGGLWEKVGDGGSACTRAGAYLPDSVYSTYYMSSSLFLSLLLPAEAMPPFSYTHGGLNRGTDQTRGIRPD